MRSSQITVCADIALNRCPDGYETEDRGGGVESEHSEIVRTGPFAATSDTEPDYHGYMIIHCKAPQ